MWDYRRSHDRPFTKYRYEHLLSLAWDFGEDTFEFAWQAIKNGNIQDVMKCTVVAGYEVRREGPNGRLVLVERPEWRGRHRLPDLDPL
jgi:ribosomal protein L34